MFAVKVVINHLQSYQIKKAEIYNQLKRFAMTSNSVTVLVY